MKRDRGDREDYTHNQQLANIVDVFYFFKKHRRLNTDQEPKTIIRDHRCGTNSDVRNFANTQLDMAHICQSYDCGPAPFIDPLCGSKEREKKWGHILLLELMDASGLHF